MLDKTDKELPWPSERYAAMIGNVLDSLASGAIDRREAIERIALVEPDCDMDDCNETVSMPLCRSCEHLMNMED